MKSGPSLNRISFKRPREKNKWESFYERNSIVVLPATASQGIKPLKNHEEGGGFFRRKE